MCIITATRMCGKRRICWRKRTQRKSTKLTNEMFRCHPATQNTFNAWTEPTKSGSFPRHPIKEIEPLGSVLLKLLALQPPSLCIYWFFWFCVWRLSSGVPIFLSVWRDGNSLPRRRGAGRKICSLQGVFCHLLLLIPRQRVVLEWWGGSAKGGGASKRWPLLDWLAVQQKSLFGS